MTAIIFRDSNYSIAMVVYLAAGISLFAAYKQIALVCVLKLYMCTCYQSSNMHQKAFYYWKIVYFRFKGNDTMRIVTYFEGEYSTLALDVDMQFLF